MKELRLKIGESLQLTVDSKHGTPSLYEIHNPAYGQDDDMGGCLVLQLLQPSGMWMDTPTTKISCWGSDQEDHHEWGDDGEPGEATPHNAIVVGAAYP